MSTGTPRRRSAAVEFAERSGHHVSCDDDVEWYGGDRLWVNGREMPVPNPDPTPEHAAYMRSRGWPTVQHPSISLEEVVTTMHNFLARRELLSPAGLRVEHERLRAFFARHGVELITND